MTSFYYLYQYGANKGSTNNTFLDGSNNIWNNNFVGAMLNYKQVDLDSMGFFFENGYHETQISGSLVNGNFTDFYDSYKTIVGSDIMSYANKYSNTNNMAMGDMVNWGSHGIGDALKAYTPNNLSSSSSDFRYRLTKDGDPYRYTENGTGDEFTNGGINNANGFAEQEANYQTYFDYKMAQFNNKDTATIDSLRGFVTSSANLTALGIDYATLTAGKTTAEEKQAVYTNLVNQLTKELKDIKPGTISEADRIIMEKSLEAKQAALKAMDDDLFGYVEAGIAFNNSNTYFQTSYTFSAATPKVNAQAAAPKYSINNLGTCSGLPLAPYTYTPDSGTKYFQSAADYTKYQQITSGTNGLGNVMYYEKESDIPLSYRQKQLTDTDLNLNTLYNNLQTVTPSTYEANQTSTEVFEETLSTELEVELSALGYTDVNLITTLKNAIMLDINGVISHSPVTVNYNSGVTEEITKRVNDSNYLNGVVGFDINNLTSFVDEIKWQINRAGHNNWPYGNDPEGNIAAAAIVNALKNPDFPANPDAPEYRLDTQGLTFKNALRNVFIYYMNSTGDNPEDASNEHAADHMIRSILVERSLLTDFQSTSENVLQIRHIKSLDVEDKKDSLIYQLAESLVSTNDITSPNASTGDKLEYAQYLGEVTAGIIEQYWIENFNNPDAENITDYFHREFRSYMNPEAANTPLNFQFVNKSGQIKDFTLNFSEDLAVMNIIDKITEKQAFSQIYSKMEDRSRAEMELFEASTALDIVQNINTQEYIFRLNMLAALEKEAYANKASLGGDDAVKTIFSKITRSLVEIGPGASKNPWWEEYFPWFKGFYGTLPEGATPDDMFDENGNIKASMLSKNGALIDPYIVNINGVDYVMGVDENKDGKINGAKEVLGINDTIETSFASLKALDLNADGIISQAEMKEKGIIFEAMNASDRLNGAQIKTDFIKSIDVASLENADGTSGVFGTFEVQLTNGKKAGGIQTFETQDYFNNLFGKYVDMSFLSQTQDKTAVPAEMTAEEAKKEVIASIAEVSKKSEPKTETKFDLNAIQAKQFNFFSYLDKENKTETETEIKAEEVVVAETKKEIQAIIKKVVKPITLDATKEAVIVIDDKEMTTDSLVDNLCWKMGIDKLTIKERYDVLGSIDTTKSSDVIVRKLEEKLSSIKNQFSA